MLIVQKYGGTSVGSIARIRRVARRCLDAHKKGHQVAVVVSAMSGETNLLLALAKKIHEDPNDPDVDGVFTTDPAICPSARKIERISYEEMLELASLGAKVLQIRSVELGMKFGVPIHVRSSFHKKPGTWVVPEEKAVEHVVVAGV